MVRSSFNHLVATAFIVGRCEASVRLVSGSGVPLSADSLSGLLQMAVNGNWKYVCDDHFMDTSHGAEVACRELGFRGGSHSAERTVPSDFFYDDIVCSGHEARLQDCPRSSDENCGTTEGVFLTCLEALAIGNERTGYCQNGLASNAWTSGTTVTMEECQALCQQGCQGISYDQSRSFCMTCSTTDDITDTGSLTWKLYDKASPASVRLVSGSSIPLSADSLSGLLQMAVNGNWKYVCDDLFIDNSHGAEVACRELGFRGGSHSAGTAPSDDSFYDEIACSGHEARLQDCPRSSDENCGATEAVFLTCLEAVSSCSIATDLATETSPFSGNTIDGSDTLSPTCGGQGGKEKIFYIDVPATYKLTIGMTSTDYDSRHETRWGGSCPGENSVACTDDPNTYAHQWQNDQGYSQHVYFHIDAFSSASGNFVLEWSITKAVGTCSSGSECESGYCRGGVCCNANGASEGCRECYSATNGDCKTCATGYYLTSNYQCQEASYCLRITTGNGANQDGPLDVSVDSGSGLVSESSGTWGQGALVLQKCYPNNILSLQVQNTANNAWAGSIEYSVNGGATYQPMICRDCTGSQVDTMLIVVDGNTDGAEQAPTHCLGGSACIISQAWGCHIGAGSACKTCVDQVHRTSDTNCATCNDGYLESSQTCQATCVNFSCPINYVIQNPVSTNYTQENCCQATCAEYDCPSNYVIRNLSSTNYTQESCCQATCAEYDCPSNYLIQNPTSTTYTEGECCQGTCAAFPCPSNYVIQNPVSTEYTQENCCQATCAAFPCPSNSLTQNLTSTIYIEANCCEACWAGSYYTDDGVEECKACSAGRHSSTSGASHCLACSAGTYASTSGASQCEECSAGRHSPTLGAATCQACSAGKYSSSNASNCSLCSAGAYSPTLGATECHNCSSGSFSSTPGHSQCRTCQVGRHSSSFGASECEANQCTCSEGSAVPAGDSNCTVDDAEVCGSCNPGYTLNGNLCQAIAKCIDGKFGLNFCSQWCNADGYWPCGTNALFGSDVLNSDNVNYTCSCEGCNGCQAASSLPVLSDNICEPNTWLNSYNADPDICMGLIMSRSNCSQQFFNHATDSDGNCGCVTNTATDCKEVANYNSRSGVRIYAIFQADIVFAAVHPGWSDNLAIYQNGAFERTTSDGGTWSLVGNTLTLNWDSWDADEVRSFDGGNTFNSTSGFTLTKTADLPSWWLSRFQAGVTCSANMKFTIVTDESLLCVPSSGGRIEYIGQPCGSNSKDILWTSATALDVRSGYSSLQCTWDWTTHAAQSVYGGSCGVAPTVSGGDQLPTACIEATTTAVTTTTEAITTSSEAETPQCSGCSPRPMECWDACQNTSGYCSVCNSIYGTPGACCRVDGGAHSSNDPDECKIIPPANFLYEGYHTCVLKACQCNGHTNANDGSGGADCASAFQSNPGVNWCYVNPGICTDSVNSSDQYVGGVLQQWSFIACEVKSTAAISSTTIGAALTSASRTSRPIATMTSSWGSSTTVGATSTSASRTSTIITGMTSSLGASTTIGATTSASWGSSTTARATSTSTLLTTLTFIISPATTLMAIPTTTPFVGASCNEVLYIVEGLRNFTLLDRFIKVGAYIELCDASSLAPNVTWSWFQTSPVSSSGWTDLQWNLLNLRAEASSFNGIGSYDLRCTLPKFSQEVFVKIVIEGYPVPIVSLVAPDVASTECDFVLDASGSEDPLGETLSFLWMCEPTDLCSLVNTSDPRLRIYSGALVQGEYSFVLVVSRGGMSPASASATKIVKLQSGEGDRPSVALEEPASEISAQVPLSLTAMVAASANCPAPTWRMWWLVQANESQAWNLTLAEKSAPLGLSLGSLVSPSGHYFTSGRYFFRLVLSSSGQHVTSWKVSQEGVLFYDTRVVSINPGPTGGAVVVLPSAGVPITTTFQISTSGWQDEDVPLTYRIQQHVPQRDGRIEILPLSPFQRTQQVARIFGTIENITLQGDAKDSLGSVSSAFGTVAVQEAADRINNDAMLGALASVSSFGDASASLSAVFAMARYKAGDKSLADEFLNAIEGAGALEDPDSELLGGVASALEAVVATGGDEDNSEAAIDMSVASKTLDIASSVTQAAKNAKGGLSNSAATSLIGAGSAILMALSQGGASSEDGQSVAPKLITMMAEDIADAMLDRLQEGHASTLEKDGLSVTIAKLKSIRNEPINVAGVTIASLDSLLNPSQARRLESCSTHGISNAKWPSNPYGYAGNTSANNESSSNSNGTSSCCELQDDSVVTIEVRACGQAMIVQDLSDPIEFDVYAEGSRETFVQTYDPTLEYDEVTITSQDLRSCQYWDTSIEAWSTKGCGVIAKYPRHIRCSCNHLSSFGGALGKKIGRFGNTNIALLTKPPKIDFSHRPFQVVLLWCILIYTPFLYCCYRDGKDYKWLSQRSELFKDKIPRHGSDYLCMILPGFRLFGGLVAFAPTYINCSKYKRLVQSCCRRCSAAIQATKANAKTVEIANISRDLDEFRKNMLFECSGGSHEAESNQAAFVGSFGPEIRVQGAEASLNQLLWSTTDPPLREHVWLICSNAQEEITMASDESGLEHKILGKKNRYAQVKCIDSIRRLDWNMSPIPFTKDVQRNHIEMQVTNVKLCHLFVEHWCARMKKRKERIAASRCWIEKVFLEILYNRAYTSATTKGNTLQENLLGLLHQHSTFSVAHSPVPLHSMRVVVVGLEGTLPRNETCSSDSWRLLGAEDAMLEPGQYLVMWSCYLSGNLFVHEAATNFCHAWNLDGLKKSIHVPLTSPAETRIEVSQGHAEGEMHQNGDVHQGYSCIFHFPLVAGCTLSVRLVDNITSQRGVDALQSWISNGFDCELKKGMHSVTESAHSPGNTFIQISKKLDGYTTGPRSTRRKLWDYKHPTAPREIHVERTGLIITDVEHDSQAFSVGLRPGMELLYVEGEPVNSKSFIDISHFLTSCEETVEAIFSSPIEANTYVTVRSKQLVSKKFPFTNQGMILEHLDHNYEHHKDFEHWHGFYPHDEIISINSEPCYHALGDSNVASRAIEKSFKELQKSSNAVITYGVHRASGGDLPHELEKFLANASVFRYARGTSLPHLSTPPLLFRPQDCSPFHGVAWLSHCGLVLSIQSFAGGEPCIGVYLEDIHVPRSVEVISANEEYDGDQGEGSARVSRYVSNKFIASASTGNDCTADTPKRFPSGIEIIRRPSEIGTGMDNEGPLGTSVDNIHVCEEGEGSARVSKSVSKKFIASASTRNDCTTETPKRFPTGIEIIRRHVENDTAMDHERSLETTDDHEDVCAPSNRPLDEAARYRLSLELRLSNKSEQLRFEETMNLNVDSVSEFTLRLFGLTLASLKKSMTISQDLSFADTPDDFIGNASGRRMKKMASQTSMTRTNSLMKLIKRGSSVTLSDESKAEEEEESMKKYWGIYNRYLLLFDPDRNDRPRKHDASMLPKPVAKTLAYQMWPKWRIVGAALMREQIPTKLSKHVPPMTRTERWATLATAINTSFFFMTLLFQPKCSMRPKPATCIAVRKNFFQRTFEPTWEVIAAVVFGLCVSLPIPLILMTCFRKAPILEQLTPREKRLRIKQWRFWQFAGWIFVLAANLFYVYWFTVFTNHYSEVVLEKALSAGVLSLVHRFFSAPFLRGGIFGVILVLSKLGPCCDILLVLCPQITLPGTLDSLDPAEEGYASALEFADSGLIDFDV